MTTIEQMLAEARTRIRRSTPRDALDETTRGAVVVDLRCPDERHRTGMIPGSFAVARSVLEWRADPASPWRDHRLTHQDARILLLCEQGYSSSLAAAALQQLGFSDVGDVIGGMEAWLAEGLPVEAEAVAS